MPDLPGLPRGLDLATGQLFDFEDRVAEPLYRHLSAHPSDSAGACARALGISESAAEQAGATLVAHGAAVHTDSPWLRVLPPSAAARARLARLEDELASTRLVLEEVNDEYLRARSATTGPVRIIEREELAVAFTQAQADAQQQVRAIMKPPFAMQVRENKDAQTERLAQGVVYRSIYDHSVVLDRGRVEDLLYAMSLGTQVRILQDAPMKLALFDDSLALAVFAAESPAAIQAIVVQPCALFDALAALFESLFEIALSLDGAEGSCQRVGEEVERELLGLMAAGYTDAAIARHWNVSTRTVERRISAMMTQLRVTSRFQAGLAARERGWI